MDKVWAVWSDIKGNFREAFSFLRERDHQRNLIIVSMIALAYVMPIVIANVPYLDDLGRLNKGATWVHDARFLNDFIFNTISFWGPRAHNFYPYSQLIGALLFAWTGYLLGVLLGVRNNATRVMTSSVLLTFPFTLGNLSFQWEPLYMGICSSLLVTPLLFYKSPKYYFGLSLLFILICAFIYQSFLPIYGLSVAFLTIRLMFEAREKEAIRLILLSVLTVGIFALVYKITMNLLLLNSDLKSRMDWYLQRTGVNSGIPLLINTIKRPLAFAGDIYNFSASPAYYFVLISGIFVAIGFTCKKLIQGASKSWNKWWILACFVGIPFLAISLLALLKGHGGFRSYLPATFALMGYLFLISWFYSKWANVFSFLLVFFSFFIVSPLAQVQKSQWELDQSLAREMMANLNAEEIKEIVISGRAPQSALKRQWSQNNPMFLNKYYDTTFLTDNEWLKIPDLFQYLDLTPDSSYQVKGNPAQRKEILKNRLDYPVLKKELHYWIRGKDGIVIMDFNKGEIVTGMPLKGSRSLGEAFSKVLGFFK